MANDFTIYDAYIGSQGLIEYEDESARATTSSLPLRPPKTEVPTSTEFEQSPSFGDIFAQGDFSGGAGQLRYHSPGRDPKRFWLSLGFDFAKPGELKALHDVGLAVSNTSIGRTVEVCNDLPFFIDNTAATQRVQRGNGSWPGTWTPEDPGGSGDIDDLASSGDELYAARGNVYKRVVAGTWSSWVTKGSTNIDRLAWVKDRLICADGRNIYEITASGALPTALETLPTGWRFESIFEHGEYIYACAISTLTQRSKIHHYGLKQDLSGLEKKGQTEMPRGQLAYSGGSYMGVAYIGAGVKNPTTSGYNGIVYQAIADGRGFLSLIKLVEDKHDANYDTSVRCFEGFGESMYFGWTQVNYLPQVGLGVHHLARDAWAPHLVAATTGFSNYTTSVKVYKGRLIFARSGVGLSYEDLNAYRTGAWLVTSIADFNNSGQKIFDTFEVSHSALAASQGVKLSYLFGGPQDVSYNSFTAVLNNSTTSSKGKSVTDTTNNVKGRQVFILVETYGPTSSTPTLTHFSIRSNPTPVTQESVLTRYYRILDQDRKDEQAEEIFQNPDTVKNAIEALAYSWVALYEPGQTWTAYVTGVSDVTPQTAIHRASAGESLRRGYVIQVQMVARKA